MVVLPGAGAPRTCLPAASAQAEGRWAARCTPARQRRPPAPHISRAAPRAARSLAAAPQVRAGVRDQDKADTYLSIASSYGLLSKEELGRLTVVDADLQRPETLPAAIGNAAKVGPVVLC